MLGLFCWALPAARAFGTIFSKRICLAIAPANPFRKGFPLQSLTRTRAPADTLRCRKKQKDKLSYIIAPTI
jgi:hypothetical protein